MADGSLTVVGTGIAFGVHLTPQARVAIERADELFYLLAEPRRLKQSFRSAQRELALAAPPLRESVGHGERHTREWSTKYSAPFGMDKNVCAAFYRHPGVFASPSARPSAAHVAEGFPGHAACGLGRGLPLRGPRGRPRRERLSELRGDRLPLAPAPLRHVGAADPVAGSHDRHHRRPLSPRAAHGFKPFSSTTSSSTTPSHTSRQSIYAGVAVPSRPCRHSRVHTR